MPRGGGITDITYVADWDAKGRSNDEEEPMRSKWIDKATGKVINLSNYSYSQMSGWGGYAYDWTTGWNTDKVSELTKTVAGNRVTFAGIENLSIKQINFYHSFNNGNSVVRLRLRISGMKSGETFGVSVKYFLEDNGYTPLFRTAENGYLEVDVPTCAVFLMAFDGIEDKTDRTFTIEQLPLYPGALVSDGVDDSASTADKLTESVGTALVCAELLGGLSDTGKYILNAGASSEAGRIYLWRPGGQMKYSIGKPAQSYNEQPFILSRTPTSPNDWLILGGVYENSFTKNVISRIILVREQLDAAQLEFLKWKVEKEYRDWCKENGYEYAITEMLNN